jgi:subtilisin family serine protease
MLSSGLTTCTPARARELAPADPSIDQTHLLVRFDDAATDAEIDAHLEAVGAAVDHTVRGTDWVVVDTAPGELDDSARALETDDTVDSVTYNRRRSVESVPNDPGYPIQSASLSALHVESAWNVTRGAGVTIAILDTGVDLDHPDLAAHLVAGRDIVNGDNDPNDDFGHGTLVAGAAAAVANNGIGVTGVAGDASIMPVKVLGASGTGWDDDIAAGITWATDHGADVINLSLGGPGDSAVLDDAVAYAAAHDVVVVGASGNSNTSVPNYPAAIDAVIAVGATDASSTAAWFSGRGWWVDVAAPGINILSTARGTGATYATATGTSLSSPLVSGVVALMRAHNPSATAAQVAATLRATARDRGPHGNDPVYG